MFCPRCAKPALPEHNFCRSCGFNLKPVSELVSGAQVGNESSQSSAEPHQARPERMKRSPLITVLVGPLLIGLVVALFFSLFVRGLRGIPFWSAIALVIGLIAGLVFLLQYVKSFRHPPATRSSQRATEVPPPVTTTRLSQDARAEQYSSVTEHTTELLGQPAPPATPRDRELGNS